VPELPEVETIARELHARLTGLRIARTTVIQADVLRTVTPEHLEESCRDRRVDRVWRRAKTAVLDLSGGIHLLFQPRFTGAILVEDAAQLPPQDMAERDPYAAIVWDVVGGGRFWYRDVRRLGTVTLVDDCGLKKFDSRVGAEPLDPAFDAPRLSGLLRGSRSPIKKVLMDQRVVAGVGNIYANESLWRAGIDPSRASRSLSESEAVALHEALVSVLRASIEARGTTFRDYRDPSNRAGGYAAQLLVYGRAGQPCVRCSRRLVETHSIDGRSTVFCFSCQL